MHGHLLDDLTEHRIVDEELQAKVLLRLGEELVEHVAFEAKKQNIPRGALGVPILNLPKKGRWRRIRELGGPIVNVAIVAALVGAFQLIRAFLNAVM